MNKQSSYSLGDIADHIGARLVGDSQTRVTAFAPLESAVSGQITFLESATALKALATVKASAIILQEQFQSYSPVATLIVDKPRLAYAKVADLFDQGIRFFADMHGIHQTAIIGKNTQIDPSVSIGPYCVIGDGVTLAENVVLGSHCIVGAFSSIGKDSVVFPRVTLYHTVRVGERARIHSGVVLGADGFGLVLEEKRWYRIPQLGGVRIGDDVDIGANTTIDRGALHDTFVGNGVKMDNLVQIAHNVKVGDHTAIAGCAGVAGSTEIGEHCRIGGGACIGGHLKVGAEIDITGMAGVSRSLLEPGVYSAGVPVRENKIWRKNAARFHQLDKMARQIIELTKRVEELQRKLIHE